LDHRDGGPDQSHRFSDFCQTSNPLASNFASFPELSLAFCQRINTLEAIHAFEASHSTGHLACKLLQLFDQGMELTSMLKSESTQLVRPLNDRLDELSQAKRSHGSSRC